MSGRYICSALKEALYINNTYIYGPYLPLPSRHSSKGDNIHYRVIGEAINAMAGGLYLWKQVKHGCTESPPFLVYIVNAASHPLFH